MENNKKENQAFIIALLTMIGGFVSFHFFPGKDAVVIPLMTFVLGYYFGSSPGSHSKDQVLSDLAKTAMRGSNGKNGNCATPIIIEEPKP
jgi:hypothetical protein